ncbi:hypothetical protein DVB69_10265 [Sporosarcina sp. BI001-red]|uniref:HMA2 domain-containing protein n=1 Tax=Sporosarcina sp. BI001-red TaxID=2282866 RepID=UPI000E228259|nr:hypothetical protein [Sporosarcina sp. BI001-red]REB07224.1 hypothetical protein DVB69_10265 [Sporosarcina sp. BI001-red]
MYFRHKIIHHIPGRMRLYVPVLKYTDDQESICELFQSIKGIQNVRIEPKIGAMIIDYDSIHMCPDRLIRNIGLFFHQNADDFRMLQNQSATTRKDLLKSMVTGVLLLIAFIRKTKNPMPDLFDYLVVISTSFTVLTHGENKISHPDVLTGIVSMASLGSRKILQVSLLTWIVNLIEVMSEIRNGSADPKFVF